LPFKQGIRPEILEDLGEKQKKMFSESELSGIRRRNDFYHKKEVAKLLVASGIPITKREMVKLNALENTDGSFKALQESFECMRNVTFEVHPQQINIRDKTNGQIIVSISK
jgi:hypothetical protein